MNKLIAFLVVIAFVFPAAVYSQDPTNKEECIIMLKPQLRAQCTAFFGSDKLDMRQACIENIDKESEAQCGRFFGEGGFCFVCTSECISQYHETDPTRRECIKTCMSNPACEKEQ